MRTTASRFSQCAFQGPGTTPVLSTDLVSNDLVLRDCYREREGDVIQTPLAHSFLINGMNNFLIDGLYHHFHAVQSLLLKTGPSGLKMARIANAQLLTTVPTGTEVVSLSNAGDELAVDHSSEQDSNTGAGRGIVVSGAGAVVQTAVQGGVPGQRILSFPNGSDELFLVDGSDTIIEITALRPKQRMTLLFTGTAALADGGKLRLNGNFTGGANRTITLVCDGTYWYETGRSNN